MDYSIVIIIVSLLLSAFFSGMEIAYVSSNKIHIELEKKQEGLLARVLTRLTAKPSKFIATMLVGNNIVLVIYGFYMGELIVSKLYPGYLDAGELPLRIIFVQTLISTMVILVTGEFLPKVF